MHEEVGNLDLEQPHRIKHGLSLSLTKLHTNAHKTVNLAWMTSQPAQYLSQYSEFPIRLVDAAPDDGEGFLTVLECTAKGDTALVFSILNSSVSGGPPVAASTKPLSTWRR